jgi:hypothetical protein
MGAWGTAVFSDDTAADIRSEYRELHEDGVPDDEASQRILDEYQYLDADEEHVLWLALAAAQTQVGRLDEAVKARALDVISTGRGLELWADAGERELARRKAVLAKLGLKLTGPQPARKAIRKPWRHVTDLQPGDILARTAGNGRVALLRVARVDDNRVGAAPVMEWLDWRGRGLPSGWRLRRLKVRKTEPGGYLPEGRPIVYCVTRHRKKDSDWQECGFNVVARVPTRDGDFKVQAWSHCSWQVFRDTVDDWLSE